MTDLILDDQPCELVFYELKRNARDKPQMVGRRERDHSLLQDLDHRHERAMSDIYSVYRYYVGEPNPKTTSLLRIDISKISDDSVPLHVLEMRGTYKDWLHTNKADQIDSRMIIDMVVFGMSQNKAANHYRKDKKSVRHDYCQSLTNWVELEELRRRLKNSI